MGHDWFINNNKNASFFNFKCVTFDRIKLTG